MGIEHFQQFNVGSDDRDQITLVLALQFGRTQSAQGTEYLIPDQRQQLEGDEMVAGLLCVPQEAPHQSEKQHRAKENPQAHGPFRVKYMKNRITAEHGNKGSAQVTDQTHGDGENHVAGERLYKADEPGHNLKSASLHTAAPPSLLSLRGASATW